MLASGWSADAKRISDRAEASKIDAAMEADQIKRQIDAAQRDATQDHALALMEAFRTGVSLPEARTQPQPDSAALTHAIGRLNALNQAACSLAAEANEAQAAATAAAVACRDIIDQIIAADARALAAEWVATVQLSWRLQDELTGLVRMGGGHLPDEFQNDILSQIDRRKSAIKADALMIELPNFNKHLDDMTARQERRWQNYGRRLMHNADAVFDEESPQ